jgi:O-antigen biosynthesis protein
MVKRLKKIKRNMKSFLLKNFFPPGTKRRALAAFFYFLLCYPGSIFALFNFANWKTFFHYIKTVDITSLRRELTNVHRYSIWTSSARKYFNFLFKQNNTQDLEYISYSPDEEMKSYNRIKLIAFYLPQFHPIPENDQWWGKGFTEWNNVSKAVPQFLGHYQPRLPGELGFYDLRLVEIQKRQAEIARDYGVYGFCIYFYWFNGKTLLEEPLKSFSKQVDFPFCIAWANENWTRRWDGKDKEVLIAQQHSEQDDIEFIKHVANNYFANKNYIRIAGNPLLVVYRPALFPDPKATSERWRKWCRENGVGEIHLSLVESFNCLDPREIGFDSAIEFPPANVFIEGRVELKNRKLKIFNSNYSGTVFDYNCLVDFCEDYKKPNYTVFRGLCPGWDNQARMSGGGRTFINSSPRLFKKCLQTVLPFVDQHFPSPEQKIIFINAWNEWGEGAYLEPDRRYGYAYLNAIRESLLEYEQQIFTAARKIIFVSHDACFCGAQLLSLHIVRALQKNLKYQVVTILLSGGELEAEFRQCTTVHNLERSYPEASAQRRLIKELHELGYGIAICNTVVSGSLVPLLIEEGIEVISLIHEMPHFIKERRLLKQLNLIAKHAQKIIFASNLVAQGFKSLSKVDDEKILIKPQGLYQINKYKNDAAAAREKLRAKLSIPIDSIVILGAGAGIRRKGIDLFFDVARDFEVKHPNVYFLWVGQLDSEIQLSLMNQEEEIPKNVILLSPEKEVSLYFQGADLYLLTSREDPFPSVVLEAMNASIPVIGFQNAGGFSDIVTEKTGVLVPYLDVKAIGLAIADLLKDPNKRKQLGENGRSLVETSFNFVNYVYGLLAELGKDYKKISVIIPSYNYARYLSQRIQSILNQTYPIYEIIFLDDASTDNSLKLAKEMLANRFNVKIIANETNSGSVFKQWQKGIEAATGDYIWIAEADDFAKNNFLEELIMFFVNDPEVVLAYCQSTPIDSSGKKLADSYLGLATYLDDKKWLNRYIRSGSDEISDTLCVENTIYNVSAVLFKKPSDLTVFQKMIEYKVGGDWFFYLNLLKQGKIAFSPKLLNFHRRHQESVVHSDNHENHYQEIVRIQNYIMQNFIITDEMKNKIELQRQKLRELFGL